MRALVVLLLSTTWSASHCMDLKFPPGFKFGAATSAYQVEGAWNVSGNLWREDINLERGLGYIHTYNKNKGENIWDNMLHNYPEVIIDRTNGDVACNSYYRWKNDIQIAKELGLHFYRFSLSWSRILPTGFPDQISKEGVNYYNKLIDGLLKKGIEPIVTLYHFDLPLSIHNLGGWANPLIADWFTDYAKVVFSQFADRIKTWVTINEPLMICDTTFNSGCFAPKLKEPVLGPYLCNKNVLMAHAKAWRLYDTEYKPKYHGRMSIANNPLWLDPAPKGNETLTEIAREFATGRYSHPIYSPHGGWPPVVEKLMLEYSHKKGFPYSRLPSFSEEERKFIQGTYDFYSLNHYTTQLVRAAQPGEVPNYWFLFGSPELGIVLETDPTWVHEGWKLFSVTPKGIRRQITWIKDHYNVSIMITENGYASIDRQLNDIGRIKFLQKYLEQVLLAIKEDGADVIGYTYWSLMDNFEWMLGEALSFGLYHVDFKDPLRKRIPRASAHYYAHVIKHHALDVPMTHHHTYPKISNTGNSCYSLKYLLFVAIYFLFRLK